MRGRRRRKEGRGKAETKGGRRACVWVRERGHGHWPQLYCWPAVGLGHVC